jgi:hypothetical protein
VGRAQLTFQNQCYATFQRLLVVDGMDLRQPRAAGVVVIVVDKVPPEPAFTQALTMVVNRADQKICTSRRG